MKRIAIVVTNLAGSGAEKVALAQAKLFNDKGHKVVLFLLEDIKTYDIERFSFPVVALTRKKDTYKFLGRFGDLIYARLLQKKMQTYGSFDMVISNLPRADRVVKHIKHLNKYFVIHTAYQTELNNFSPTRSKEKRKGYQYLYRDEKLITVTDAMKEDLLTIGIRYKSIQTIYNPFDFSHIRKKVEEKLEEKSEGDYIVVLSAFRKEKRYDVLLDAVKMLHCDIRLIICAKYHAGLQKMIDDRGLNYRVKIIGFVQNPYQYIKHARLLVLSSEREGLPTVLIESLIVGTPVVSTDCPTGPREILTGELSQYLAKVNDSGDLAKKIDLALKQYPPIENRYIEKFNAEKVYTQFVKLLPA